MKKILSYILIFILIILFISTIILNVLKFTILSPDYIIHSLEKNDYYTKVDNNIKESFKNQILSSGLEEDVLNDLYSFYQVKQDINGLINSMYNNAEYKLSTDTIRTNLQNKIDAILNENNRTLNSEEKDSVDRFINSICNAYETEIEYSSTAVSTITHTLSKVIKILNIIDIILVVAVIICAIIIVTMRKSINVFRAFSIVFIATGILLFTIYYFVNTNIAINNILIVSELFSEMIGYFINLIINIFMIIGIINVIIGILFAILYVFTNIAKTPSRRSLNK